MSIRFLRLLTAFSLAVSFEEYPRLAVPLCSGTREASIDAASAITRLSVLNMILSCSGRGNPLTKDQRDSIDLENRKGR
jgi:hypothetical protein